MQVFQIKGLTGALMFILALIGTLALVFLLPSSFLMVFWNATVFEGLNGPMISIGQALILWLAIMVLLKIIFKPEVQLQFYTAKNPNGLDGKPGDNKKDS